jgi:CubicO group peptidase (beta-lactamase class C family)
MKKPLTLLVLVFLLLIVPTEAVIALLRSRLPREISVARGVVSKAGGVVDSTEVNRLVTETMRRSGIPGVVLAIVQGERILHTAGYGRNADGTPVTADTAMAVASLSKSFTAVAVMQLVEKGKVELEAPIRQYLPEFSPVDLRASRITVHQLLNHSSGLTFESLPGANVRGRTPLHRSLEERVIWLSGATLRSEPGTQTTYDNFGYEILARLVERISGKSFGNYLKEDVFAPLRMDSSRSFLTTRDPETVPTGHTLMFGIPVQWSMPSDLAAGAGGIVSSAIDMARWLVFQNTNGRTIQGEQLLKPETVLAMHNADSPGGDYGFGWRQATLPDGTLKFHHSGRIVTYAAHEALFPQNGMAYAFMCNGLDPLPAGGAALIAGLDAIVTGRPAFPGGYSAAVVDHLIVLATAFVLTIGVVGVIRSRRWAQRVAERPLWRAILRCSPYAAAFGIAFLLQQITVPWTVWWETWPPFAVAILVVEVVAVAIVVSRAAHMARPRRSFRPGGANGK